MGDVITKRGSVHLSVTFFQDSFCNYKSSGSILSNSLLTLFSDDKNLTLSKLKAFTDDKINVTRMIISVYVRVENIVGKGENAGYQHFLLFPQCFEKVSFPDSSKGVIVWE